MKRLAATIVVSAVALACFATVSSAANPSGRETKKKMTLTSPAFADGEAIPDGFTCTDANASPPLRWKRVAKEAKELAIIMLDPDAPIGTITHWLVWGIDPKTRGLPEETLPSEVVQGANQRGTPDYLGPCPPPGSDPHHYGFTLYALSKPLTLESGASLDELKAAMKGTILARDKLVGTYAIPASDDAA